MRYFGNIVLVFVLTIFLGTISSSSFAMDIVKNGKAAAVIVVAKDAPKMVNFAATELQTYIEKISGAKLAISNEKPVSSDFSIIYIGESNYTRDLKLSTAGLKSDGFKIISGKGWLAMLGRESEPTYGAIHPSTPFSSYDPVTGLSRFGETGSLYAVYRFLEKNLGVHWFMPGDIGEVVPKSANITIGRIRYTKSPDLAYRYCYYDEYYMAGCASLWYRRAGFGAATPVSITHSFSIFSKYAKSHPEYFALINGERDTNTTCGGAGSLCLSDPGTLNAFVKEARTYFDNNPGMQIFPVMPNDGWNIMCQCPKCKGKEDKASEPTGKFSNYLWDFVNKVGIELAKTHPDKQIGCCAYSTYIDPPKNIKKLNSNVVVMICKTRMSYWNPIEKANSNKRIEQWAKKAKNLYFWEYYLYAAGYDLNLRGLPVFCPSIIAQDLKHLKKVNRGEFIESESWLGGSSEKPIIARPALITPNLYITGKLYWDCKLDPQKLMDEYCKLMYGPAEKKMRAFWAESEKLWMTSDISQRQKKEWNTADFYTPERVKGLMSRLKDAAAITIENTPERKRIEMIMDDMRPTVDRICNPSIMDRPRLSIPYAQQTPVIDGVLDDSCWKNAAKIDFRDLFGQPAIDKTSGLLTWDDSNLYIAFVNDEPNINGMAANHIGQDANLIWDDECMDILFKDENAPDTDMYQLILNSAASVWDAQWSTDNTNPTKWDSRTISNTKIGNNQWVVETSIPLSSIGLSSAEGKTITANFYRSRNNKDTTGTIRSGWVPVINGSYKTPSRFGYLAFSR